MSDTYAVRKTLSEDNQFHFVCPVFDAETPMSACFTLREMVWMAKPPETRKGCQFCMKHNKCPINNILWDMMRVKSDPYHSPIKKVGKLSERHIAGIERIIIDEKAINQALEAGKLNDKEAAKIRAANEKVHDLTATKTKRRNPGDIPLEMEAVPKRKRVANTTEEALDTDNLIKAAMTGDMSGAISVAKDAA